MNGNNTAIHCFRKMKEDLLTSVFTRCKERLRLTARRFLADDTDVDDVLQEAFCRLWKHREELSSEEAAEGVSVVTVRNISIDTLRRSSIRRTEGIDDNTGVADLTDDSDDRRQINERYADVSALIDRQLSERDRRIIYLRDRDGWEFEDIALEMGISEANVRVILSRARKTIRECYIRQI